MIGKPLEILVWCIVVALILGAAALAVWSTWT